MDSKILIFLVILSSVEIKKTFGQKLIDSKIIGGSEAIIEKERHFASIRFKKYEENNGFGNGLLCGGSLISEDIVITAAHCLYFNRLNNSLLFPLYAQEITVVLGSTTRKIQQPNTIIRSVKRLIKHPNYNMSVLTNDIALLVLNETALIPGNLNTAIIQLNDVSPNIDTECRVSGFGYEVYVRF